MENASCQEKLIKFHVQYIQDIISIQDHPENLLEAASLCDPMLMGDSNVMKIGKQ